MDSLQIILPVAAVILVALIIVGFVISKLYVRSTKESSFVKTGLGGQKVVMNGGAVVFPVIHETIRVNMNTLRLEVRRTGESALITKDRIRVDVHAEFFVRVKPTEEAIADAAQTLGLRTQDPIALKELVEGKFVDALRAVAAEMSMEELHEQRVQFVQRVQTTVSEDILKNGLELESVSLTSLDQTSIEFLNPNNAFDAQGLAKLTETIEAKRKQRNDVEQETRILIETKNLVAEKESLSIRRDQEYAQLEQQREIEIRRAAQVAEIARERAARDQEAKQAEIAAQQLIEQTRIASEREVQESQIAKERQIKELDVLKQKALETAEIDKLKALELAEQDRAIAIAEKSRAKSEAEALAAKARAEAVRAEEEVVTVRESEIAERRKRIELITAAEQAEKEAIKITVAAEAEVKATEDRATALRTLALAEAEQIRIAAKGQADAIAAKAEADARRFEVEAVGKRAINEAENLLSDAVIQAQIKKVLIAALPDIIRESVEPMKQIDSIKIMQVEGLGGGSGASHGSGGAANGEGSLADQLVNSALRYRGQAPLVDALMQEIGIKGGDINGAARALTSIPTASTEAAAKEATTPNEA
ncbi:MAG: flotillin domain-containing protein [Fimbriimonadaceae bacterium]|nr:flotillin domain-containing protein [Fimbriimonadaceae bacterium]